jgi:hypothetical protein
MHVDTKNDRILAFVTTSQLQFFKDNPRLECEIVRVEPGLFRPFTKETAIDCRDAYSIQIGKLDQLRADGKLEVKGRLPGPVMGKVFDTVRASRLLSRKLKRLLAPCVGRLLESPLAEALYGASRIRSASSRSVSVTCGMPLISAARGVSAAISSREICSKANLRAPHINCRSPWATRW